MFRSAVTASSRALLRVAAATSLRPSSLHRPVSLTSPVASTRPLLPCVSTLRFPFDFSRGYASRKHTVSSDDDVDYSDYDDVDFSDYPDDSSDDSSYGAFDKEDGDE